MFTNSPSNTNTNPLEQKAAKGLLNVSPHGIPLRGRFTYPSSKVDCEDCFEPEGAQQAKWLEGDFSEEASIDFENSANQLLEDQVQAVEVLRSELRELDDKRKSLISSDRF